jgi:ABC-type glycerol-3-phosphate transport system substrate-binding protein
VPQEQQEAAWKFIDWLTSDENAADFSRTTGYVPVTKGAVTAMEDYFKETPAARTAVDFLQYAQSRPQSPSYNESQEILVKALQKAVLGEASVKEALDEAAELMAQNLQ